jgi:hypothetical protein
MFNIAMCEKALSLHADAIHSFHRYFELETSHGAVNPKLHDMAEVALAELYQLVGQLEISDAPAGATVSIDGDAMGTLPRANPIYLMPGKYTVKVNKRGFEILETDVVVAAGAKVTVRADLKMPLSQIQVICDEEDATVSIDGKAVGPCPYAAELPAGQYEVEVTAPDRKSLRHVVSAEIGKTTVIAADLQPIIDPQRTVSLTAPAPVDRRPADPRWVLGGGIATSVVGAIAIGMGGLLTHKWGAQMDAANRAIDRANDDADAAGRLDANAMDYNTRYTEYENAYTRHESEANESESSADSYRVGFVLSYTLGGALVAVGAGLLTRYALDKRRGGPTYAIAPNYAGMTFEF